MRRWSELGQVERVDLYTRVSLYLMLWLFVGVAAVSLAARWGSDEEPTLAAGLAWVAWLLVVLVIATPALRDVMDVRPPDATVPWRTAVPLLVAGILTMLVAIWLSAGRAVAVTMPVALTVAWALGGLRHRRAAPLVLLGCTLLVAVGTREVEATVVAALVVAFVVFTVRVSLWVVDVVRELDQARAVQAALAVAEERLRFSRDVHDVMGRRLSAMAVQAELAARLAERGEERAGQQMMAVHDLAHETLRETRELARGYRPVDLGHELEGARSLLRSAGIDVELAVTDVPEDWQEPAAWVVREAVTNVLRHSSATRVAISYRRPDLVITNDRPATVGPTTTRGTGLAGLHERLAPLGASVSTDVTDATFSLVARLAPVQPTEA